MDDLLKLSHTLQEPLSDAYHICDRLSPVALVRFISMASCCDFFKAILHNLDLWVSVGELLLFKLKFLEEEVWFGANIDIFFAKYLKLLAEMVYVARRWFVWGLRTSEPVVQTS